ncbi:WXG100 family type VII secretion target [Yimella sp. cx-573]|nr:WXG100 family type VII secretion target [Yimella sp. cx-573]
MAYKGMDDAQVESSATQLAALATKLDALVVRCDVLVGNIAGHWHGQDAQTFRDQWYSVHRRSLTGAAAQVHGMADSLRRNVTAQRDASGADAGATGVGAVGGTGSSSGGGSAKGGDPVREAIDDVRTLLGTYGFVSTLKDLGTLPTEIGSLPAEGPLGKTLGIIGVLGSIGDLDEGVKGGDGGAVGGAAVDLGLAAAAGSPLAPLAATLQVGKEWVDFGIPYSGESQDSTLEYVAQRDYGVPQSELSPAQAQRIAERYSGPFGWGYMISDTMDSNASSVVKGLKDIGAGFSMPKGWW